MQYALPNGVAAPVVTIHRRLLTAFDTPVPAKRLDPVSQLVLALLNVRTSDEAARTAFDDLLLEFGCWDRLQYTAPGSVEPVIRAVVFPEKKAVTLPTALRSITARRGSLTLDFLDELPTEAAWAWLKDIPGVSTKVGASVLNLSTLERRTLVVDTHHHRVAKRLRLAPRWGNDEKTSTMLGSQMPSIWTAEDFSDHHGLMKQLGQTYCAPTAPSCGACPLLALCPTGQRRMAQPAPRISRDRFVAPGFAAAPL